MSYQNLTVKVVRPSEDADEDYSNIDFNGYSLYVNGKAVN